MDELLIARLRIISNTDEDGNSIAKELSKNMKINSMSEYMQNLDPDGKSKTDKDGDIELCRKFLKYYWLLLPQSMYYSEVADAVNYIKQKHQNIMTTAHSVISDRKFERDIYLNLEEYEDMQLFISWFEQHFKNNQEKDEGEYT